MSDDPNKRGRDRELVSTQEHELAYLMRTANVSRQKAKEAVEKAGPSREKVMAYLKDNA
jgi:DNA-directed RNA polymerase subunit F